MLVFMALTYWKENALREPGTCCFQPKRWLKNTYVFMSLFYTLLVSIFHYSVFISVAKLLDTNYDTLFCWVLSKILYIFPVTFVICSTSYE